MVHQENGGKLPPFWEKHEGTGLYINKVANCKTNTKPAGLKGGKESTTLFTLMFMSVASYYNYDQGWKLQNNLAFKCLKDLPVRRYFRLPWIANSP